MCDLATYYARRAAEYEAVYLKPERQEDLRRIMSFFSTAFADLDVLEIACGTGYWTQFIAQTAATILASDINDKMIRIARQKDYGHCRVRFNVSDAYSLRVKKPRNAAFHGFWWSHIPVQMISAFLEGFHANVLPRAKVIMIDNLFVEDSSTPITRTDEFGNTYQQRRLQNGTEYEVLKNFPSTRFLRRQLDGQSRGFKVSLLRHYWIAEYMVY